MAYPELLVAPMRAELTNVGFTELKTAEEVVQLLDNNDDTILIAVNSVCGCAAGCARPGIIRSLSNEKVPVKLYTVFAGMETEAVNKVREYTLPYPPSSPSVALFKNGEVVHFVQRMDIEGHTAEQVSENLKNAYNQHC